MSVNKRAVGLFYSWDEVKNAILALKDLGFNREQINLTVQDKERVFLDTNLDIDLVIVRDNVSTGLVDLGIPETKSKLYGDRIKSGSYFLMVEGSDSEIYRSEQILNKIGIEEFAIYDAFDLNDPQLQEALDRESRITNQQSFAKPDREMSVPDNDADLTVVKEIENLF